MCTNKIKININDKNKIKIDMNNNNIKDKTGYTDIHTHFLPGVDDGAHNLSETMELVQKDYNEGVRTIIFTPHYRKGMFEKTPEEVEGIYNKIEPDLKRRFPEMEFRLGRELHATTDIIEILKQNPKHFALANSEYLLTEFSSLHTEQYIREKCYEITAQGLKPIIAHIERYPNIKDKIEVLKDLKKMGVKIQVNTDSISGKDGFMMKRYCKKLIKKHIIDFIATDGHDMKERIPAFEKAAKNIKKYGGEEYAYEILIENPNKILEQK